MSGAVSIQAAFLAALRGDNALGLLLADNAFEAGQKAIYDYVPQADDAGSLLAFPYITVGDSTEAEFDTDDSVGRDSTISFHVWSRYKGRKEVKGIMDAVKTVLHDQPLTVSGETVILVLWEFSDIVLDPDGMTFHGVTRFRIITVGT